MLEEGKIRMSLREFKKLSVVRKAVDKSIKQKHAAELLELSHRQVKRLIRRVREEGEAGLIHKLRGRVSNRRISELMRGRVIKRYRQRYDGFGPTLAREKLVEEDGIEVSRETLRQWLMKEGLWKRARKVRGHRQHRERKSCFGEMIQVDGSHHDWLEGRGPKLVLMGYIDDATGRVFAGFYDYEGTLPAMDSFYRYTKRYGLPQALYLDKHTTYKSNGKLSLEDELAGKKESKSQFQRALEERLGVDVIHANSPQAKGRIERLFRTFQDRLVKEMRLRGIKTREEANGFLEDYLPKYNRRFMRKAKSEVNLHRKIPYSIHLKQALSIQTEHVLRNDNTIRHEGRFYQIHERWKSRRPKKILVQERLDGKLYLMDQGRRLRYRQIQVQPRCVSDERVKGFPRRTTIPGKDHPWRKFSISLKRVDQDRATNPTHLNAIREKIWIGHRSDSALSTYPHNSQRERKKEAKKERERTTATSS